VNDLETNYVPPDITAINSKPKKLLSISTTAEANRFRIENPCVS
jgi:hypothetical protein